MRILTLSDIHGDFYALTRQPLPYVDLVLIAGDLTNFGLRPPAIYRDEINRELGQARDWMSRLHEHCCWIMWVQGNHDIDLPDNYFAPFAHNIRDRSMVLSHDGMRFSVRGVSSTCTFNKPELVDHLAHMTSNRNEDAHAFNFRYHDIVVSHSPPFNCLDTTIQGVHLGSPALKAHIYEYQPKLVVCGHVHASAGTRTLERTLIVNSARRWHTVTFEKPKRGGVMRVY